jgi:hypothetical protein
MDTIWFARNKLIYEAIQLEPPKIIQQLKITHEYHISAWQVSTLSSLWFLPWPRSVKGNFDVTVSGNFVVAAAVIRDPSGEIFFVAALLGEAYDALLAYHLAASSSFRYFSVELASSFCYLPIGKWLILTLVKGSSR